MVWSSSLMIILDGLQIQAGTKLVSRYVLVKLPLTLLTLPTLAHQTSRPTIQSQVVQILLPAHRMRLRVTQGTLHLEQQRVPMEIGTHLPVKCLLKQLGRAQMIINVVAIVEVDFVAQQKEIQKVVLRVTVRRTGIVKPVVQIIIVIAGNASPVLLVKRHHRAAHLCQVASLHAPVTTTKKFLGPTRGNFLGNISGHIPGCVDGWGGILIHGGFTIPALTPSTLLPGVQHSAGQTCSNYFQCIVFIVFLADFDRCCSPLDRASIDP